MQPAVPLPVTVVNGNLRFIREPLILGHYRSLALTGTERVMDDLIGGVMGHSLAIGRYPDAVGSQQVFLNRRIDPGNPLHPPRPTAVIVVGLGDEGKLRATDLSHAVSQGAIAWAQREAEKLPLTAGDTPAGTFRVAATLVGSGGVAMSAGQSACLVAQGIREANMRLVEAGWPTVDSLSLIELYHDRATEAWLALRMMESATPGAFAIGAEIVTGSGALPRPLDAGYRGAEYDLITAVSLRGAGGEQEISYTVDSKRARAEVRAQGVQQSLLRELVATASHHECRDRTIGRTLFQLLVPVEMEAFLGGSTAALLEVDSGTAGIPWELLDTESGAGRDGTHKPWAIRTKVLRRLRTSEFRGVVVDANRDSSILIIGEPACDTSCYPRLPGARREANAVAKTFEQALNASAGANAAATASATSDTNAVRALVSTDDPAQSGADARTVINTLLERDWRVVHISGHGEPPEAFEASASPTGNVPSASHAAPNPRGVVLSNGTFLGPREIRSMRVVPELVFVNCCHLAARDNAALLQESPATGTYDRARFAANVAEELIMLGVRCVIAAGWAIEDEPAGVFATTFYQKLLEGERFIDAVNAARTAAYNEGGNTWAAYQCYGDPDWRLRRPDADPARAASAPQRNFANVASATSLRLLLETLAINGQFGHEDRDGLRTQLHALEQTHGRTWGHLGAVAEAFGRAWAEAGEERDAIAWYQRALSAEDGGASLLAAEQSSNLRVREAWSGVRVAAKERASAKTGRSKRPAKDPFVEVADAARAEIDGAIAVLEQLTLIATSAERETLLGSAWKRKAQLEHAVGDAVAARKATVAMRERYQRAEEMAWQARSSSRHYPGLNIIAADMAIHGADEKWKGLDAAHVAKVRESLSAKADSDPDFWSVVGLTELRFYEAAVDGNVAAIQSTIESEFADLYRRVGAKRYWRSVYEQAVFALSPATPRRKVAERKAVDALLGQLEGYAAGA